MDNNNVPTPPFLGKQDDYVLHRNKVIFFALPALFLATYIAVIIFLIIHKIYD